jgi:hypothetical protein
MPGKIPILSIAVATAAIATAANNTNIVSNNDAAAFVGIEYFSSNSNGGEMKLQLLNDTNSTGAVCLDGSPGGFYYSPAANADADSSWQIYFQGGGWCYDEMDCYGRSQGGLGSSKNWPPSASLNGIVSSDCTVNPDFCNFHRVWMAYCDGNSFSGNRDEPVVVNDKKLYFRGRRIIDETLKALSIHYGMKTADTVMLTGCSAGGLATYLHTDYVHNQLKEKWSINLKKFKAAAISGFFLQHATVEGKNVYPEEMKYIFHLANSTNGLNKKCIDSYSINEQWKCNFAQNAYAYTESMTFPLNSALDSWQTGCIYTSELVNGFPNQKVTNNGNCSAARGWSNCSKNPENCSPQQMITMNQYITDFDSIMSKTVTYNKNGNGAFIHSCHTHCEAQTDAYNKFQIDGVTMQNAVSEWWRSDGTDPSSRHTYAPCKYNTKAGTPHMCNPSCRL